MIKMKKRTFTMDDREFETKASLVFYNTLVNVDVYEVIHPERKFFRKKFLGSKCFLFDGFETVEEGVIDCIAKILYEEEVKKNDQKNGKAIDKIYKKCYNKL